MITLSPVLITTDKLEYMFLVNNCKCNKRKSDKFSIKLHAQELIFKTKFKKKLYLIKLKVKM